jgi:hypothetical protein
MKIIRIPKTPISAFDKERPASDLLKAQVRHVHNAEQKLPARQRSGITPEAIETEQQVADYVGRVVRRLHPKSPRVWRLPPGKRAPMSGVWLGPTTIQKPTLKRRTKSVRPNRRPPRAARKVIKRSSKAARRR